MKLGILSDTHGRLRPEVAEHLTGCDHILHAGDIDRPDILERLEEIAPGCAVRGNNDWGSWAPRLPRTRKVTLGGVNFFMVHNRDDVPWNLTGVEVVVFGHSHQYFQSEAGGRLWLNPGSCGWPRFGKELTMAVLTVQDGALQVERIDLEV